MRQVALAIVALFSLVSFAAGGTIDGKIVGRIDKPFSPQHPAVVWLEGIMTQPASDGAPVMARHGGQFVPSFLVVVAGQTVSMPNEDEVAHNVYSLSTTKQFNLGYYARGEHKTVTFDRPGLVEMLCVIHSFMRAKILVVPNKYYATVAADGSFHIRNVPAGTFTLTFWTDGVAPFGQEVTVPEGGKPLIIRISSPSGP
jgi:plastocyanin